VVCGSGFPAAIIIVLLKKLHRRWKAAPTSKTRLFDSPANSRWDFTSNELPRSRAARYQKEFSFNPDAEHRGILLIKKQNTVQRAYNIQSFFLSSVICLLSSDHLYVSILIRIAMHL
jgi:hypothetical protein